jgi:hypothetical protein
MDDADAIEKAARMLLTSASPVTLNTEELDVGRLIQVLARTARLLMFAPLFKPTLIHATKHWKPRSVAR